ncbi:MAG: hypothetical protein AAF318_18230 [Pseudomonadota bacterium]
MNDGSVEICQTAGHIEVAAEGDVPLGAVLSAIDVGAVPQAKPRATVAGPSESGCRVVADEGALVTLACEVRVTVRREAG